MAGIRRIIVARIVIDGNQCRAIAIPIVRIQPAIARVLRTLRAYFPKEYCLGKTVSDGAKPFLSTDTSEWTGKILRIIDRSTNQIWPRILTKTIDVRPDVSGSARGRIIVRHPAFVA